MDKERRALQLTKAYITAVKRLEEGVDQDLVLIPFSQDKRLKFTLLMLTVLKLLP
jgi:hypothetical protein